MTDGFVGPDSRETPSSQADGLEKPRGRPGPAELQAHVRLGLWGLFAETTRQAAVADPATGTYAPVLLAGGWEQIATRLAQRHLCVSSDNLAAHDAFLGHRGTAVEKVLEAFGPFFVGAPGNRLLDLLEEAMRHEQCPPSFIQNVKAAFNEDGVPYFVDTDGSPTIIFAANAQERHAIEQARRSLTEAEHPAAGGHLRRAEELLRDGQWRESVHESISAVESLAKSLVPGKAPLGTILETMQRDWNTHPAFCSAMEKLFGWASNEPGVRHGGADTSDRLGRAEAAFMIPACAAFCTYLLGKRPTENDG
ncbi:MAG: hypothetical protein F4Z28_11955 [Gammaproteobacteria bacterium]|nr:hypothetical protein [Gammaproteobacteria bacterium]